MFYTKYLLLTIILNTMAHDIQPLPIGNFANERKPVTNFGFGQNITTKNNLIIYESFAQQKSSEENYITLSPEFLYGITNELSFFINIPIFLKLHTQHVNSSGIGDLLTQLEYAWFIKRTLDWQIQSTLVTNITFPTGAVVASSSAIRHPSTGYGALSFFVGFTASYLSPAWYLFISDGGIITKTGPNGHKVGNTFLYQFGGGYNLGNPDNITLLLLLEFNGIFAKPNKNCGKPEANSGGNIIYVGPSIYASRHRWVVEAGIQLPLIQHNKGIQPKQKFRSLFTISAKF